MAGAGVSLGSGGGRRYLVGLEELRAACPDLFPRATPEADEDPLVAAVRLELRDVRERVERAGRVFDKGLAVAARFGERLDRLEPRIARLEAARPRP